MGPHDAQEEFERGWGWGFQLTPEEAAALRRQLKPFLTETPNILAALLGEWEPPATGGVVEPPKRKNMHCPVCLRTRAYDWGKWLGEWAWRCSGCSHKKFERRRASDG